MITYIIPNYNCGQYLKECIASLESQTSPDWKALICDDLSTDNSREILKTLNHSKITCFYNEKNRGVSATRDFLIKAADTDIIAILDPDDCLYPQATEKMLKVFDQSNIEFVYSRYHCFDATLTHITDIGGTPYPVKGTTLETGFISHLQAFKRQLYTKIQGYDPLLLSAEDRDLIYQIEEVTVPKFIDEVLYKYRILKCSSLSNSPYKKERGLHFHFQAQKKALKRRNIKGIEYYFYCMLFKLDTIHSSDLRPEWQKHLALKLRKKLVKLDKKFKIRKILYN